MSLLPPSTSRDRRAQARSRGSALLWAVALMSAVVALVLSDMDVMRAGAREKATEFAENGVAAGVAQAGVNDALAWLRRQRVQPVTVFAPQRDLGAEPPVNETDDPGVGLVREYEISPGVWGRYEVRAGRGQDPFDDANGNGRYDEGESFVDLARPAGMPAPTEGFIAGRQSDGYGDGQWTPSRWTRDVSTERGWASRGTVWRLESRGLVYRRERADLPLGRDPNVLLAAATVASEVRRMVVTLPAKAALCAPTAASVTLGNRVRVRAPGELGIALGSASTSITIPGSSSVDASTRYAAVPGYDASVKRVFGVDWTELKSLADLSTRRLSGVPDEVAGGSLVVLERDITYGPTLPLRGTGVLAVRGDLTIQADSKSYFSGVLYVEGDVTIAAPVLLRGTIIATGRVELRGASADYVEVEYDPATVSRILGSISAYRFARAVYVPDRDLTATGVTLSDPWGATPPELTPEGWPTWDGYGDGDEDDDRDADRGSGTATGWYRNG